MGTLDRLKALMAERDIGAVVAMSPENVAYTIGFMVPSHPVNRNRRTISVVTADGKALVIVVSVEADLARQRSTIGDIRAYDQFTEAPMEVLAACLRELGVDRSRVGLELDYIPAEDYLELTGLVPNAGFVGNREVYLAARIVKTDTEIERLRRIAQISDEAEAVAFDRFRVGITEKSLAAVITQAVLDAGGDAVRMNIGSGERSGIVNPKPSDRQILAGDVVRVEILATLDNYQSNVTRTAVVGSPTGEQQRIWRVLMDARARALEPLAPKTPARLLWKSYSNHCRSNGIEPSLSFLGHGIGLTAHEEPYLTSDKDIEMTPGMVITYEPFYMIPGRMGFHIEDMFLITDGGYDVLTTVTTNDFLIQIG